jgi:hypothetical protein
MRRLFPGVLILFAGAPNNRKGVKLSLLDPRFSILP